MGGKTAHPTAPTTRCAQGPLVWNSKVKRQPCVQCGSQTSDLSLRETYQYHTSYNTRYLGTCRSPSQLQHGSWSEERKKKSTKAWTVNMLYYYTKTAKHTLYSYNITTYRED